MRRNNVVFLVGEVVEYAFREMDVEGEQIPVLDLLLQTDSRDLSGRHKVMALGQQAVELSYLLVASQVPTEVMVLGWLRNGQRDSVVVTERVTAIVDSRTRQIAVSKIREHQRKENSQRLGS